MLLHGRAGNTAPPGTGATVAFTSPRVALRPASRVAETRVRQLLEPDRPEGGGEVLDVVVAVAGHGRRLERVGFVLDPSGEVVGEGLAVVALNAGAFAGQDSVQGVACGELGGEAAAAQGLASPVETGQVDGKGSTAVTALRQGGAAGAELAACGVAAAAAAVDTSPVGIPGHWSSLRPAGP
jgi:hypothetical protein